MGRAEILTIGDELLSGETVDTNAAEIEATLEAAGWPVARHVTVADDEEAIAEAFREAGARAALVISSGGLGPTIDDLTLAALARALGCGLRTDEAVLARIRARFERLGRPMTPNNERQARVPELGEALANDVGTAPAFHARLGGADVFTLPGVPSECRWLMQHAVLPRIAAGAAPVVRRNLKVVGIGESRLEHLIRALFAEHPGVRFGFRTLGAENQVKLAAEGPDRAALLAAAEQAVRGVLGGWIYGADAESLASVVGAILKARGETVATAESCTGGLASKLLTDVPGSSAYVLGGCVAYANEVKMALIGVRGESLRAHGAVSRTVAEEMAQGARARFRADWAISTTGIAGPEGGTPAKPVGRVYVAIAGPDRTVAHELTLGGDREQVRVSAAKCALELLRRHAGRSALAQAGAEFDASPRNHTI